ncbi:Histidyl-tRNA synthetase [Ignavibacterium album JCM 16511]|uniref:Histidine--tRNA ligase n=1 Tax=Ignavibacterium album (strain DSM 19864 / JCM 16511 / NBRC 101810 / Mat9-16) TaxID=945713 RepID=I0AHX8_IGNAJ|nr:histidine--tRNA ligase [Ignavibacterium album]AFH48585.1 Histidyl-tRNA synthetase [Ignavibacterium album JCM 16511]
MIKAITGTKDILPTEIRKWYHLENLVKKIFHNFNYKEIRTPVIEETSLFARGIGEETDIVSKEMYTFKDRSDTSVTLKPEMTAGVVRAFIEHSLGEKQPLTKLFYISPMFRQERPQAGRLRQFHQFGAEALGSSSPLLDAEMIEMAFEILRSLGLKDLSVKINSLGIPSARENYKSELRKYLSDKKNKLTEESKIRFEKNILRIFDSKAEQDQEIMKNAPLLIDYLDAESKNDFEVVKTYLKNLNIPFEVEPKLVRGLDYYTKTTFEIISGKVGAQSSLCGGGRYDLLVGELGGKPTPGVGFAAGMERILLACENENVLNPPEPSIDIYLVRIDNDLLLKISELASYLRKNDLTVDYDYLNRSVKAQMREANKMNARFVLFVGGDEFKNDELVLKNLSTGHQENIKLNELNKLISRLKNYVA